MVFYFFFSVIRSFTLSIFYQIIGRSSTLLVLNPHPSECQHSKQLSCLALYLVKFHMTSGIFSRHFYNIHFRLVFTLIRRMRQNCEKSVLVGTFRPCSHYVVQLYVASRIVYRVGLCSHLRQIFEHAFNIGQHLRRCALLSDI